MIFFGQAYLHFPEPTGGDESRQKLAWQKWYPQTYMNSELEDDVMQVIHAIDLH